MSQTIITTERMTCDLTVPDYDDMLANAQEQSAEVASSITDTATCAQARMLMNDIGSLVKHIEEQRVAAKAPYLATGKQIDALAKKLSKPFEACVDRIQSGLAVYVAQVENERYKADLERQRLELEAQKTTETTGRTAPFVHVDIPVAADVAMTTVTDYEVDMALLPKEYCLPNEKMIREAALGGIPVPGVTVIKRKKIVNR